MLRHGANYKRANHARQSAHTIGDAHEDASVAWCNIQVVDIETLKREEQYNLTTKITSLNLHICVDVGILYKFTDIDEEYSEVLLVGKEKKEKKIISPEMAKPEKPTAMTRKVMATPFV